MPETLRDRLAAVLGPGNDDTTAYQQADAVLDVLWDAGPINLYRAIAEASRARASGRQS